MLRKCLLLLILINICSCGPYRTLDIYDKKKDKINKNDLIKENSGLIVLRKMSECTFQSLEDFYSKEYCGFYQGSDKYIAVKLKKNRYFFDTGLVSPARFISLKAGFTSLAGNVYEDFLPTFNGVPSVVYFDIEPGDIVAVDSVNTNKDTKEFRIINTFETKKKKHKKIYQI